MVVGVFGDEGSAVTDFGEAVFCVPGVGAVALLNEVAVGVVHRLDGFVACDLLVLVELVGFVALGFSVLGGC